MKGKKGAVIQNTGLIFIEHSPCDRHCAKHFKMIPLKDR